MTTRDDGLPAAVTWQGATYETPALELLEEWIFDSLCEALDGCTVEHDGRCHHGAPSWLRALRLV